MLEERPRIQQHFKHPCDTHNQAYHQQSNKHPRIDPESRESASRIDKVMMWFDSSSAGFE